MDFIQVVRDSGLTKKELACLYGVSRQTIYNWLGGRPIAALNVRRVFESRTQSLAAAIGKRVLPLPAVLPPTERNRRLESMLKTLNSLPL